MTYPDPTFDSSQAPMSNHPPAQPNHPPPQAYQPPAQELSPVPAHQPRPTAPAVPPAHRAYRPGGASDPEFEHMQRLIDRAEAVQRGKRDLAVGALWLVGGLVITLYTVFSNIPVYVLAWGPMLYGLFRMVKGILAIRRNRS